MSANLLIGVGGTGAKVVEAALHCAAAGLGPDELLVAFVDQDDSNGNVTRAKQLLAALSEARSVWRGEKADRHRLGPESALLRTAIRAAVPGQEVWAPNPKQGVTLAQILGRDAMPAVDQGLFDLLFTPGPLEQDLALDEGYRGRPHVGAAAMASQIRPDDDFWRRITQHVKQSQAGVDVRVVLAGSVFGGTGAAGFPTLARLIRERLKQERIDRNVRIGGALMLPYFSFEGPEAEEGPEANVARAEQLLAQSREALTYYHGLFRPEQDRVFDELYLVGWHPPFHFPYHSPGSGEQANPALLPELIAAMGVCRFLQPGRTFDEELHNPVFVSGRANERAFDWNDLPSPTDRPDAAYQALGQMLRFAAAWLFWRGEIVERRRGFLGIGAAAPSWFRNQGVKAIDFAGAPPSLELDRLSEYARALLVWAAQIQHFATRQGIDFRLWNLDALTLPVRSDVPMGRRIEVQERLAEQAYAAAFDRIVTPRPDADPLPGAATVLHRLEAEPFAGGHTGAGQMVGAVHAYSAVRA